MPDNRHAIAPSSNPSFEAADDDDGDVRAMQTILPGQFAPAGRPGATADGSRADDTPPFAPQQRPPMALLCVLYDGDAGGEWIPLRADRSVIARTEGDIRVPHDGQISGRAHAEIVRTRSAADGYRWHLADLGSTNGTFVRVSKLALGPGTEVLFGRTRYRFEAEPAAAAGDAFTTARPGAGLPSAAAPALVETTPAGDGARVALLRDEYWLGRDPNHCAIVPRGDPYVSPRHARIFKAETGRWRAENNRSRNGMWMRLTQPLTVAGTCHFLLGEQRFLLKVLNS